MRAPHSSRPLIQHLFSCRFVLTETSFEYFKTPACTDSKGLIELNKDTVARKKHDMLFEVVFFLFCFVQFDLI